MLWNALERPEHLPVLQMLNTTGGTMITLVHQLERENLESYYNLPDTPVRERELEYQGDTWVLLIHNSVGIYYCI